MQTLTEVRQPEPTKILVESIPVQERKKLFLDEKSMDLFQNCSWHDLRGLLFVGEEDWS